MKKGLLSILAGALVVVGCQNYDDQFDQLEKQISALSSTVAGLSQVQSDLASLSGTVASLASTVNGLGSQIDTAVANGLADIQSDIEAIEAAVADVASGEAVDALTDAVTDAQADLDELLANSSIFNDNVTVTDQNTLDVYHAMGSTLAIVNGNVSITVSTGMDVEQVQELVDNIINVTGSFSYTANTGVDTEVTFSNLAGTATLTLNQKGGYMLESLTSATAVTLTDHSTADVVHLGALTTVTSLSDGSAAGTFEFDKADELHLTSLPRYAGSSLSLKVKEGGVIAMPALKDVAADGTDARLDLTIDGPSSIEMTAFSGDVSGSTLTLKNIASAIVTDYDGNIVVGNGVVSFSTNNAVSINLNDADDIETLSVTGALDPNATTADTAGPDVSIDTGHNDLVTATFAGVLGSIDVAGAANLETLTISADLNGDYIDIDGNNDLTSITVTGAKIGNVTINANTDLETLVMDHTTDLASGDTGATASITSNTNLETLTWSADDVDSLTITDNTQLATVNFTGLKDLGTSTTAVASIQRNDIDASLAKDSHQTTGTLAAGTDTGNYTTTSGIGTLQTWLDAALAATGAKTIGVYFDEVTAVTKQTVADGTFGDVSHTDGYTSAKYNAIAYSVTTAATGETIRQRRSFVMAPVENGLNAQQTSVAATTESVTITASGVQVNYGDTAAITTIASLIDALDGATDFGADYTVAAAQDSYKKQIITVNYKTSDGATAATTVASGVLYFTYGTITGTVDLGVGSSTASITSAIAAVISGTSGRSATTPLNLYNAEQGSNTDEIIVYRTVSYTGYPSDLGPNAGTFPPLTFTIDAAQTSTTVQLSGNASNTAGVNSNTFFLNASDVDLTGVRVTVTNNSTSASRTAELASGITNLGTPTVLVSGTNTLGTYSLIADFSDVADQTPASTATVDRTSWLGS